MIRIRKISIHNFGSIADLDYQWDNRGINIIQGKNGSGKTTLISSLVWVLFGQSLKGTIEPWVNKGNGTKVELFLTKGEKEIRIVRCRDYKAKIEGQKGNSKVFLWVNGEQTSDRDKSDVNRSIIEILGINYNVFKNTVLFGQKMTRLVQEAGPKQKKLFEDAFRLDFITKAKEAAEKELAILEGKMGKISDLTKDLEFKLELLQNKIESGKRELATFKKNKEKSISEIDKTITSLQKDLSYLRKAEKSGVDAREKFTVKSTKLDEAKNSLKALEKLQLERSFEKNRVSQLIGNKTLYLESLEAPVGNTCPECGNPLPREKVAKLYSEYVEKRNIATDEIGKLEDQMEGLLKPIEGIKKLRHLVSNLEEEVKELSKKLRHSNKSLINRKELDLDEAIQTKTEIQNSKPPKNVLASLQSKLDKVGVKLEKLALRLKELNRSASDLKWLTSQALSNKGLKNHIFKTNLKKVNAELKRYRMLLGLEIFFEMDLSTKSKTFKAIMKRKGININYEDLSGGQQQLVDVCLALSIHEVMNENNPFNILILDEVFESLDIDNIELVSEILSIKAKNKSVHLITHNANFIAYSVKGTMQFKLVNGITVAQ